MDKNHFAQRYEPHLSALGKKVLQVLVKQWDRAHQQNNETQFRQIPAYHKRVITFNDNSVVNSPYVPLMPTTPSERAPTNHAERSNLSLSDIQPKIFASEELIETVSSNNNDVEFLHPIIAANKYLVHSVYNEENSDDENIGDKMNNSENANKNIDWNMLDSEFFVDLNTDQVNIQHSNDNDKIFEIRFPTENRNTTENNIDKVFGKKANGIESHKRKIIKPNNNKTKKVRREAKAVEKQNETIELAKEGNKNSDEPKTSFRKQKYTTIVKNWLGNVGPRENLEEDILVYFNDISNEAKLNATSKQEVDTIVEKYNPKNISSTNLDANKPKITSGKREVDAIVEKYNPKNISSTNLDANKPKITLDKTVKKSSKKVIQAQLANKDGVMKYSKPRTVNEDTGTDLDIKDDKQIGCKVTDKTHKEKKVKKFVAPIKSQVPVKDIRYDMFTVTEHNVKDFEVALMDVKNNEILAILIHSNGFSQLNIHYTDSTCVPDGIIINSNDMFYCFKGTGQKLKETLKQLLTKNTVICYAARDILIYLASYFEMEIDSINIYDAKIGASLLDPDNAPENFTDLQKFLSFTPPYTIATECMLQKSAWYMTLLKDCWTKLFTMLVEDSLWKVFVDIEMKLLPIIADMEHRGVLIDMVKLKSMEDILQTRMKLVEQECYKAAGKVFQINSTVQVRAILYDELLLDTKCNVKIRETISRGAKSTSESMLRSLMTKHPLPKLILEYRHLHKAHATFLSGIAQHVKDSVVKPKWVQIAAATGRIASNNPNLQAIPKTPFNLVMFPDADSSEDTEQLKFRSVYVSRAGHSFVAADFKHVECRVFAHAAADTGLLQALTASEDLFRVLAARWLNKPESLIVCEERERTKRLVYASLYGAGTRKLMEILDVSYQQALQVVASFNRTFPALKSFGRSVVSRCSQDGGRLTTLCGRVRRFNHIDSQDFALKSHAERQAVNFVVQGSAADLCKIAMIATNHQLRSSSPPVDAYLVLQIHDELVWEVSDQHVEKAAGIIKQVMERCGQQCGMSVTLPVAISVGKSWGDMEEFKLSSH